MDIESGVTRLSPSDAEEVAQRAVVRRAVYVYEAPIRAWHWINAAAIFVLMATSCKRGTFTRCTGCAVSKVAHICGKAAFLAPEIKTSPCRLCPPRMRSLSIFKR